ncbi:MAG: hypothetical protein M1820_009767 [Bogoriella megaspora]|nr:MAG: hypothetical protein M1820_009767 [Bogoriella megaspora]
MSVLSPPDVAQRHLDFFDGRKGQFQGHTMELASPTTEFTPIRPPTTPLPKSAMRSSESKTSTVAWSNPSADDVHELSSSSRPTPHGRSTSYETTGRRNRPKRPRTTYNIAHPPPARGVKSKIPLLPRVLLQLQKAVPEARPVPAFEVLSAAAFALRTGRSIASLCSGKSRVRPEDLVVLQGQDYSNSGVSGADKKSFGSRYVVGVICCKRNEEKHSPRQFEISLGDGSVWQAKSMPNGGYEFSSEREPGVCSITRWVRKNTKSKQTPRPDASEPKPTERSFAFSTMSRDSRQHPIVATMTPSKVEVFDHYTIPGTPRAGQAGTRQGNRASTHSRTPSSSDCEGPGGSPPVRTEDWLRDLIIVTGIWVAFREGWSITFRYDEEHEPCSPSSTPHKQLHRRCPSFQTISTSSESGAALDSPREARFKENVKGKFWRTRSKIIHRSSTSMAEAQMGSKQLSSDGRGFSSPRRVNSTGANFIRKANRNTSYNITSALDLQETSELESSPVGLGIQHDDTNLITIPAEMAPVLAASPVLDSDAMNKGKVEDHNGSSDNEAEDDDEGHRNQALNRLNGDDESILRTDRSTEEKETSPEVGFLYRNLRGIYDVVRKTSGFA